MRFTLSRDIYLTPDPTGFDFKLCASWIWAQGRLYREYNKLFPNQDADWL